VSILDLSKLKTEAQGIKPDEYTDVYPYLISYFEERKELTAEDFIRGAHMVYAWMPTMLSMYSLKSELKKLIPLINQVRKNRCIKENEINTIAATINNSVVGTSKLLHFISPEDFPIWDSRVYTYIYRQRAYGYRVNNAKKYLGYIELVNQTVKCDRFKKIHSIVNDKIGYDVTAVRAIEAIMFYKAPNFKDLN